MNKARRASLNAILNAIIEQKDALEIVCDEEETARDNMPESLQGTERYDNMSDAVDAMYDAIDSLDEAIEELEGIF